MPSLPPQENPQTLREQGREVISDVRQAALHATRHIEALAQLLQLELGEYARGQARRMLAAVMGAVLLVCAYLMLCFYAVVELQPLVGTRWALLAVVGVNVVLGLVALLVSALCKPAGVAPATLQELKNDVRCVQLYLKGREKS